MATRSRYKPDESSCNQLVKCWETVASSRIWVTVKTAQDMTFSFVGNANVKKTLLRFNLKAMFLNLYISFWKEIPPLLILAFLKKSMWLSWVPTPSSVPGLPGLDQELGELCHLPCLCTWCRKPWALRLLLEFGLFDSWLQGRESGSLGAHSRLTDRKWANDFAEVEN